LRSRLRLGILLWSSAMPGAVAVAVGFLPQVATRFRLPGPLWLIALASLLQSAALLALATWSGTAFGAAVGLRAPAFEAVAAGRPAIPALKPQVLPGLLAGVVGGVLLLAALRLSPAAIADLQGPFTPPLYARLLYGGVTEEVLLRFGVMTAFAWLAWRLGQGGQGAASPLSLSFAIVLSALLFGVGHLPAAWLLVGALTGPVVLFVVGLNAAYGVLFGWLYWRRGLESAMIAHATMHMVAFAATEVW
jgi:membrane protease YdiL (CAAX protease family)